MLELKQTQKLSPILTQQLQQAIRLLQLSKLELVEAIEQEIKENPILEVGEEQAEEQTQETKDDGEEIAELLDRFSPSEEFSYREEKEYPDYENIIKKPSNLRGLSEMAGRPGELRSERTACSGMDNREHRRQRLPGLSDKRDLQFIRVFSRIPGGGFEKGPEV